VLSSCQCQEKQKFFLRNEECGTAGQPSPHIAEFFICSAMSARAMQRDVSN
jgi:hypothetical protein